MLNNYLNLFNDLKEDDIFGQMTDEEIEGLIDFLENTGFFEEE